jgi:hypothetical protein
MSNEPVRTPVKEGLPSCHARLSPTARFGVALAAAVRVVDADLVPGLAALEPGRRGDEDRHSDAAYGLGERLAAVVQQVLRLAGCPAART